MTGRQANFLERLAKRANGAPDVRPRLASRFDGPVLDLPAAFESRSSTKPPRKTHNQRVEAEPREVVRKESTPPQIPQADRIEPRKTPAAPEESEESEAALMPKSQPEQAVELEVERDFAAEEIGESELPLPADTPIPGKETSLDDVNRTTVVRTEFREHVQLRQELLTRLVQSEAIPDGPETPPTVRSAMPVERRTSITRPETRAEPAPVQPAPIEITIGHIEVRAASERPSATYRMVRKSEPATSLGDYLKSREAR